MAIYAEAKEQYKLAPAGQYQVVCCEVLDLGFKDRVYKNPDTKADESKQKHEIQYVFQLNKDDEETGKRFEIRSQPFNLILSEKASLRKFLLSWRGHDLTDAEKRPPGVNVDLAGTNAIISVVHNPSGDKTYANIASIMPLMDGMPLIVPIDYQAKQEYVDKANQSANTPFPAYSGMPEQAQAVGQSLPPNSQIADADIPF